MCRPWRFRSCCAEPFRQHRRGDGEVEAGGEFDVGGGRREHPHRQAEPLKQARLAYSRKDGRLVFSELIGPSDGRMALNYAYGLHM